MNSQLSDGTVQRFAEIMSALSDPFASRDAVLSKTGHAAASWERVEREWTARIAQDTTGELARAYAESFSRAGVRNDVVEPSPEDPRFLSAPQPFRTEAAAVQLSASGEGRQKLDLEDEPTWPSETALVNRTAEIPCHRVSAAMPFQPVGAEEKSGFHRTPAPRRIHEPPIRPASGAGETLERTMEVPVFARPSRVLPFEAPRPVGRLHRFDTQTGLPLANPIWIDEAAADPTKSA